TLPWNEHRRLSLEPVDRAVHHAHALGERSVVDQVAGGDAVRTIQDHVVPADQLTRVGVIEARLVGLHQDVRVEFSHRPGGGPRLATSHVRVAVDYLALQVAAVYDVVIDDADAPDA